MQPIVMPAVTAFSTFSIRISRSTELALSSRSPARERWRLRLLRYFPGAELAPDRNAATLARRGTTLKKGRSPIAIRFIVPGQAAPRRPGTPRPSGEGGVRLRRCAILSLERAEEGPS